MAHTTFEQSIVIAAPREAVRDELAHLMTNVSELHPFVIWTRLVKTETAPDGSTIEYYQVRDRMKLGPFTIAFTYKVDMNVTPGGQLISNAYQSPGIHLFNQTSFAETANGTLVSEHIDITAPALLLKTTYEGAAVSHKEMFARLKEKIEAKHQGEGKTV
ncbi:MAG TPA: SRPBCC family protein [Ktedonobacteraceae bacterium]|nr:SRPBCC family protein [Ktedonobacteraceae bacterium]